MEWVRTHPARASVLAGWYQQGCGIIGAIVSIPLIIHSLGETMAGLWFALIGILTLFSLTDFGFSMAISRQAAYTFKLQLGSESRQADLLATKPGWEGLNELYSASYHIFLWVTAVAGLLLIVLIFLVLPYTHLHAGHASTAVWSMMGVSLLATFQSRLSQAFLEGIGYMYLNRFIAGSYIILWNLLNIAALSLGFGIEGLAVGILTASLAQYLAVHLALRKIASGRIQRTRQLGRNLVGQLWRVAVPYGIAGSGGYLVSTAQPPLLALLLGPAVVTPYYIALRIGDTFNAAVSQITSSQGPFFTHETASGAYEAGKRRFKRTLIIGCILHGCVALAIYFGAPTLVYYWIGPGEFLSKNALLLFSLNYLAGTCAAVSAIFVLASGRNPFALTTVLHGVLTVAGILVFCPKLGLIGAPLASLLAVLLTNFWYCPYQGWITWKALHSTGSSPLPAV
ncbi:MAG: rane protein involved in the export of O-antigen and teichoic acid [Chthoniobacteraceae bacterium]|nr:rane protein involved in the export of O-antigen and teichoic acid [Chthoniobacteraceae bacterium]